MSFHEVVAMARNVVQFQKGLSEPAFEQQSGTEERCRAIVIASRWPHGFECPVCGGRQYCVVTTRDLYQCAKCRRQTSPIAGTIFASTHLPLRLWFRAIYHLTQTKQGISSIELGRRLGVTQTTAWKIKHKLKQVMLEPMPPSAALAESRSTMPISALTLKLKARPSGHLARHLSSPLSRLPPRESLSPEAAPCHQSSAQALSQGSPSAISIQTVLSSAMAFSVSPASPMPGARTKSSRPGQDQKRLGRQPSNGSTPRSATSRPPSQGPIVPSTPSMSRATSPNSNTASTDDTIWPP